MGPKQKVAVMALVFLAGGLAVYGLHRIPAEQRVDFELKAGQGTTEFSIAADSDAVSPGCGCGEPELEKQHWQGMSVPSVGFDLGVETEPSDELADRLWALTVFAPGIGPMDWYGFPGHSLWMSVIVTRPGGAFAPLYAGPASHLLLMSDKDVSVAQPRKNPYAAILPAAGGMTTFSSHEAARTQWGSHVDISINSPKRPAAELEQRRLDPEVTQRGPMLDVLGPTVNFTLPYTKRTRMWAAGKPLMNAPPGGLLEVEVATPFALRLIPHPVQLEWQAALPTLGSPPVQRLSGLHAPDVSPLAAQRVPLKQSLPEYEVRVSNVESPDHGEWLAFATRSENRERNHEMIPAMMGDSWMDPMSSANPWNVYALPPVTKRQQIGVFGGIKNFKSTSVGGQVVVGSNSRPIPRGEKLEFISETGLSPGAYKMTPLVASGQETAKASIFGSAEVWIGGDLASHPDWFPWIPFSAILGAILGGIVGVLFTEIFNRWIKKEEPTNGP
jgi:hypothetical protein